jgi:hypothetical protein
MCAYQAHIKLA